ncbi:ATP-dependent DNA helicase PIF1-like protein, partial [Tanacetum coccineum]
MATFLAGYINDLSVVKDNFTLRVRILRTWMQQVYVKQHITNLELIVIDEHQDTEATSSSSRSVTPRDLESQKDENTTPINAAKTIATTWADKDPTKKRVAEDDIGNKTKRNAAIDQSIFSPEFINGLKFSVVPNYRLALKVGVPIMLWRNIDQPNGLCNGTRLQVLKLTRTSISAQIINETHFGNMVIILRLRITPSDKRLPLKIVRKQYPISLSFATTINKCQGQSLSKVGLYLPRLVFTHGQLYVVVSRVKSKKGLKVVVFDPDGNISKTTTNVVYKEELKVFKQRAR